MAPSTVSAARSSERRSPSTNIAYQGSTARRQRPSVRIRRRVPSFSNAANSADDDGFALNYRLANRAVQRRRSSVTSQPRSQASGTVSPPRVDLPSPRIAPILVATPDDVEGAERKLEERAAEAARQRKAEHAQFILDSEIAGATRKGKRGKRSLESAGDAKGGELEGEEVPLQGMGPKPHKRLGVVQALAQRHRAAVQRRDEERRRKRQDRFANLDVNKISANSGSSKQAPERPGFSRLLSQRSRKPSETSEDIEYVRDEQEADRQQEMDEEEEDEHNWEVVQTLDVMDPGVSAVSHLSNIANSIVFPPIPGLYSRAPVIDLPTSSSSGDAADSAESQARIARKKKAGQGMDGTDEENEDELALDEHMEELLTKKQQVRRALKGVWAYLKTPLGILVGIYGFLVVFSGAALVIFLAGWIDHGHNKDYWVEVFSQFVNALFTITGVGLIPWRVRDTYRMARICHYQHLTWRLRRERGLPKLRDCNDLPEDLADNDNVAIPVHVDKTSDEATPKFSNAADNERAKPSIPTVVEEAGEDDDDDSTSLGSGSATSSIARAGQDPRLRLPPDYDEEQVLKPRQADKLHQLQHKFAESATWYRAHETSTHRAFPISWALGITLLNVGNSLFQCLLCAAMWGYATHYKDRPAWTTGSLIPLSFSCGIGAGVLIWRGGERTKKREEVEERLMDAFAEEKRQIELDEAKERIDALAEQNGTVPPIAQATEPKAKVDVAADSEAALKPVVDDRSSGM